MRTSLAHRVSSVLAAAALGLCLAACGSGSSSSAGSPASTSSPGQATKPHVGKDVAAITRAFVSFFSGSTSADQKVSLVQDGSGFSQVIHQQAGTPLSQGTTAKVLHVKLDSPDLATVRYTVLLGGDPALKNQTGQAVREHGHWKVASATFCRLLSMEQSAPALCTTGS